MNAQAREKRDRRLRRGILLALKGAMEHAPTGALGGVTMMDYAESGLPRDQKFDDETHALRLARELVKWAFVTEERDPVRRGEAFGLRHCTFRITDTGINLLREDLPVHPGVWDERLTDSED